MARRTVVIGDSLGVGTVPYLQRALGGRVAANVKVGRSSADGVNQLSSLLRGGADRIVMDLGTNDASPQQLRQSVQRARRIAGDTPIFIPTVRGPNAEAKNRTLRELAGGNVRLVNWARQSNGLVGGDGIHATGQGYQRRAEIVAHSISRQGGVQSAGMIPKRRLNALQQAAIAIGAMHAPSQTASWMPAPNAQGQVNNTPPGSHLTGLEEGGGGMTGEVLGQTVQRPTHGTGVKEPAPAGSLADLDRPDSSVLLGQGVKAGGLGRGPTPFQRSVVNRGGKLFEAHSYGEGAPTKYFQRKDQGALLAASQTAAAQQAGGTAPDISGLTPAQQELIKRLLGNPTLSH